MGGDWPALTVNSLTEEIRQVAEPIARALGLEIIEVQCFGKITNPSARVVMDKEGGIGIQECEEFHQALRRTWELTKSGVSSCRFEVSSPGLDRPLKDHSDFKRVTGKLVKVTLRTPIANNHVILGRLVSVSELGIQLGVSPPRRPQHQEMVDVKWEDIVKARLEVEF
ncbi:MAG: ribosome maturation factor RimP [Nitrospirales bacterium]